MADSTKHFNPVVTSGLFKPQKHTRKTNKKTHTHSHVIKMFYSKIFKWVSGIKGLEGHSFLKPSATQGVSLWRVKSSGVTRSKIYKWVSGIKGLLRA